MLELSYSPEFFFAPGEPEGAGPTIDERCRPVSLYSAIAMAPDHVRIGLAERFGLNTQASDFAWRVIEIAKQTNTCRDSRDAAVEVWIDSEGTFRLDVYPSNGDTESEWLTSAEEAQIVTFHRGSMTCPNGRHFIKLDGKNVELDRVMYFGHFIFRISKNQACA